MFTGIFLALLNTEKVSKSHPIIFNIHAKLRGLERRKKKKNAVIYLAAGLKE